ncbi:chemotaxis protein CheW [Legionella sp. D16C41]|uniref:chemotaxis protein CheW n=1 Tax=Legionella sp. D16C41 TaxID=3402688 RepID=UPI003AF4CDDF
MEEAYVHYLKFRLNEEHILLDLNQIQIVLPIAELEALPNQDAAIAGLLNFHTTFIPIYHLATLLNMPKPSYDLDTPIIICLLATKLIGLLVSEVLEVSTLTSKDLQNPHSSYIYSYVDGVVEDNHIACWLLNLEKLLNFHQLTFDANEHTHVKT